MSDDSPSCVRNPSPPRELCDNKDLLEADVVSNTTFSKHWLFSTLMKLIEVVDQDAGNQEEVEFGVDVDEELQNELCKLWDMSMNTEVVKFLQEFKAIDIFVGVIGKSKAPRVTEICVGILGNMACDEEVCITMSENEKVREMILLLLDNADPQTLNETTRFLHTSLSNSAAKDAWIEAINSTQHIQDHIHFIFQSSTNSDLLRNTAEFVDVLLDLDEHLCEVWATPLLVQSLLEAIKQIGCGYSEALETCLHIFQLLSTSESGVESLVECAESLCQPLMKFLEVICEDEIVGLEDREGSLASAFSVLNVIFTAHEETSTKLVKDEKLLRIFIKVLEPLFPCVQQLTLEDESSEKNMNSHKSPDIETATNHNHDNTKNTEELSSTEEHKTSDNASSQKSETDKYGSSERTKRLVFILYKIIQGFMYDFMFTIHMALSSYDEDVETDRNEQFRALFSYLNSSCSRQRLNHFILALKDTVNDSYNPVDTLCNSAQSLNLDRLNRIITDVLDGQNHIRRNSQIEETDSKSSV